MNLVELFKRCYTRALSRGITWIPVTENTLPAPSVFSTDDWVLVVDLKADPGKRQGAPYVRRAKVKTLLMAWRDHRQYSIPMQFSHWTAVPALPDYGIPDEMPQFGAYIITDDQRIERMKRDIKLFDL